MYDIEKIRRASGDIGDGGLFNTTNDPVSEYYDTKSTSYGFPVETYFNTTIRGGWHFANKTDWDIDTDTKLNTFDLETCYSIENNVEAFLPKPLNFVETSKFDSRVIYSDAKINNSAMDSWRKFRLENYRDLEGLKGSINKLIVNNDIMYFLQDYGFGKLSINPVSTVVDNDGSSIILGTGSVIQDFQYISNNIGCNSFKSVVGTPRGLYWFDSNNKKAYAFRANGLESISDTHGVKSLFSLTSDEILNNFPKIVLGYDYKNNEVLYSIFDPNLINAGETIVFSEDINKFTSRYSFYTPMYINAPTTLLSINPELNKRNEIFEHNSYLSDTWYNNSFKTEIEFIINKHPLNSKVFDNLEWYAESDIIGQDVINEAIFSTSTATKLVELISQSNPAYFPYKEVKEKLTKLPVPRTGGGYRFRDTYLKVKLITENTAKVALHYVKTIFRISRR